MVCGCVHAARASPISAKHYSCKATPPPPAPAQSLIFGRDYSSNPSCVSAKSRLRSHDVSQLRKMKPVLPAPAQSFQSFLLLFLGIGVCCDDHQVVNSIGDASKVIRTSICHCLCSPFHLLSTRRDIPQFTFARTIVIISLQRFTVMRFTTFCCKMRRDPLVTAPSATLNWKRFRIEETFR